MGTDIGRRVSAAVAGRGLERPTAAEAAAAALRELILEGGLRPGERISEEALLEPLAVSRNTLREAFRLLAHEKLVVHRLNRGVSVRQLEVGDVADLYRVRRVLEGQALQRNSLENAKRLFPIVDAAVLDAEAGRWGEVGAANMRFHQTVVSFLASPRLDDLMTQVCAELRLGFLEMGDPRSTHERYLGLNNRIASRLSEGMTASATELLDDYLDTAERHMTEAITAARAT